MILCATGSKYAIKKMFELDEDHPQQCIIIGTIFKHQTLKPSILKELSEETQLAPQPPRFQYSADDDLLILEDELQRIRLVGDAMDVHQMVTGIVCAVLGMEACCPVIICHESLSNICVASLFTRTPFATIWLASLGSLVSERVSTIEQTSDLCYVLSLGRTRKLCTQDVERKAFTT